MSILYPRLQTMPESNNLRKGDIGRLRALQSEAPPTRVALVRQLWPDIGAALAAGHSLTEVHRRLVAGDFDISYRSLVYCVNRIRLEQAKTAPARTGSARKPLPKVATQPTSVGERDPMANLRKYGTGKVPGFHLTGEPPDPKKLF